MNIIKINFTKTKQKIDGFGASGAARSARYVRFNQYCDEILELLFDKEKGAGISIVRNTIGDSAPDEKRELIQRIEATIEPEEGKWVWNKEEDCQIWLMEQAKKFGCTTFYSVPWSPPAWMKDNNSVIKGSLRKDKYRQFAEYLAEYVNGYKKHFNLDIYAISVQNEPESPTSYSSCVWTPKDLHDFVKEYLIPVFREKDVKANLVMAESANYDFDYVEPILDDPETAEFVNILASHGYWRDPPVKYKRGIELGKRIWQSEYCGLDPYDPSMKEGIRWARIIHEHMVTAENNAFFFWYMAHSYWDNNEALINIDIIKNTYFVNKRFWAFANFSRFIRPGYVRVDAEVLQMGDTKITVAHDKDIVLPPKNTIKEMFRVTEDTVYISAYKSQEDTSYVIVAVNDTDSNMPLTIDVSESNAAVFQGYRTSENENLQSICDCHVEDGKIAVCLKPRSVTTYTSR